MPALFITQLHSTLQPISRKLPLNGCIQTGQQLTQKMAPKKDQKWIVSDSFPQLGIFRRFLTTNHVVLGKTMGVFTPTLHFLVQIFGLSRTVLIKLIGVKSPMSRSFNVTTINLVQTILESLKIWTQTRRSMSHVCLSLETTPILQAPISLLTSGGNKGLACKTSDV